MSAVDDLHKALDDRKKIPPRERFDKMVRDGLIDEEGNLLREGDKEAWHWSSSQPPPPSEYGFVWAVDKWGAVYPVRAADVRTSPEFWISWRDLEPPPPPKEFNVEPCEYCGSSMGPARHDSSGYGIVCKVKRGGCGARGPADDPKAERWNKMMKDVRFARNRCACNPEPWPDNE